MFFQEAGKFYIRIEERFESSHFLYKYFSDGSDEPIHGHSFKVEVYLSGRKNIGEDGISFDFLTSKKKLRELVSELDHILINEHIDFKKTNPTSENMARWFYNGLKESVHAAEGRVERIVIHEGPENLAFFEPLQG
ncbi:6-pyruvoyl tetrahydropterin synthase/QueD family protein [Leptospira inadai serovar Lyme str. 10]|uniref:6-carboxy-5,6,7,8-tetrahydropterin synthase n=2 Tax=Leptospira inadai serovar Lyme TaxID=293084 RepID=V6HAU8_9LEPT|nr:6-carboxytetrahydropterin synthase [Leptospira inadai]EQA36372.1 6-pyruvoyl tetrahydropterin synthase/QueD family protein [Leptospira inadai serovar Lyme str. 10]PNV74599.1 6-carboxytetrahydropterin synthase [Leptospira inadai serovar Lyme]